MSMIIMGIDPGTRITGYCIISEKLEIVDLGIIKTPVQSLLSNRYLIIYESIKKLINQFVPFEIAIENQFVKKNIQSALKLAMAKAMAILAAAKKEIPIYEYTPASAKKAVVGNGNANKMQIQKTLNMIFAKKLPLSLDISDSLAVAFCHINRMNNKKERI